MHNRRALCLVAAAFLGGASALAQTDTAYSSQGQDDEAPDMAVIAACATADAIGTPACDDHALAEALGLLADGDMRPFHDQGMESFAMLTALRYGASALYFAHDGDGCYAVEERGAAVDIWRAWVTPAADLPPDLAAQYEMFDSVLERIAELEIEC